MEQQIYKDLTRGVRKPKHKIALFLCGAAGSGKTTYRQKYLDDMGLNTTHVLLSLDYITSILTKHKSQNRTIFENIISKTLEDGYSFYYEGTCRYPPFILQKMEEAKKREYVIKLGIVYADLDTVIKRVKERINQPLSEVFVRQVYQEIEKNIEKIVNLEFIDEVYLYNNQTLSKLIFYKNKQKVECISPDSKFYFDVSKYC